MKDKFKEIYQKAAKSNWSGEQLEAALKDAGATVEDVLGMEELDLEQMASVAGGAGADPATCDHRHISRHAKYSFYEDGGLRARRIGWTFRCFHCGQRWEGTDENFNLIEGWKGEIIKM